MNLKHKLRAKINPIEFGHTGFHAVHEGVEAAAPRGVARAPAVPAGGAAGHGAAGGVPDSPGPAARQAGMDDSSSVDRIQSQIIGWIVDWPKFVKM